MSLVDQQWCPTSVQVTALQARGLRIKGKSGTNDAYAVIQVGKEKYQTSVVEKSVSPVWKEEATFELPHLLQGSTAVGGGGGGERSTLRVHVLHRALVGPDKLLGQAVINLSQLSEDKTRTKTEWFKLLDKTGKPDKDRGEVLLDIQFMRNSMTASMFDLSAAGKSRSRLGKFKDKVRGKKKESDSASSVVPSFPQVMTDSEDEANGDHDGAASKDGKSKKHKIKSLFSPKSNLQRNMSQSMSVLPAKNSSLSGSQSSGLNVDSSEGKKKFKFMIHKRSGSSDSKESWAGHQKQVPVEQSNLCINGSHVYCEEPPPRTSRIGSNFSLASSGHGSMEDVPESSPPSVDSLRAVRQYSPWMEEEEEEEEEEKGKAETIREDVEKSRGEDERIRREEEEETIRRQQEELKLLAEEKNRKEEEEKAKRMEEERIRKEEEKREEERVRREEEQRLAEEKKRLEEERARFEEEKMRRREEQERFRREEEEKRQEEERQRQEERKLAEERRLREEERRIEEENLRREEEQRREEERRRKEAEVELLKQEAEQRRQREEEERLKKEEARKSEEEERARKEKEEAERLKEKLRQEEEWKIEAERIRKEEEERMEEELLRKEEEKRARIQKEMEEKRKLEEKEKMRVEQEKREREQKRKEEELQRLAKEKEKQEEERRIEEERVKREEEERLKKEEDEKRENDERMKRQEMEEMAIKEKERLMRLKEEEAKRDEEERIMRQEEERRKEQEREEQERIKKEEEEIRKEKRRREEAEERVRKEKEVQERLMEETRRLEEQEKRRTEEKERVRRLEEKRRAEEERTKREEQERIWREEEERSQKEEQRARKEEEENERLVEMTRLKEQEKRKIEEEEKIKGEEKGGEQRRKQGSKPGRLAEENEEENKENYDQRSAVKKTRESSPAEVPSTNPFDETFSQNPSEEVLISSSESDRRTAEAESVEQRCRAVVSSEGSGAISYDEKDVISTQREKRQAPQPPGWSQAQRQTEQDASAQHLTQINKQSKDKDVKTASVLPQRPVQTTPSKPPTGAKNTQSSTQNVTTKETVKHTKRPAPSRPCSDGEQPSSETSDKVSHREVTEAKQVHTVYGLNPFDDDDDGDDDELAAHNDAGPVRWPPAKSQTADEDTASQVKVKSMKMARAPPPPAKTDATPCTSVDRNNGRGRVKGGEGVNAPKKAHDEVITYVDIQENPNQGSQQIKVQTITVAAVKEEGPPASARRLQPVKPLNPLAQSTSVVQEENDNKSTGILAGTQDKTKVNATGIMEPYSQLTKEELICLVLKQDSQLLERDKKISELEQYIDNLLVRVMEEQPSILMSMNSIKKAAQMDSS